MIELPKRKKTKYSVRLEAVEKKMIKDYMELTNKYPTASFHKKCEAIAEKYCYSCQAVKIKLEKNGITRIKQVEL